MPADFSDVLDFWFAPPQSRERGLNRKAWFRKDERFDEQIRERFLPTFEAASAGKLDAWSSTPYAGLALIVVLDQFPRNLYRGEARAFSSDARALSAARRFVERRFDRVLRPLERVFAYLPFEHCEDLAVQRRALALFERLERHPECADFLEYARRHHEIIARFGRFPHRNEVLGRTSSTEEAAFLQQPGSRF